MDIQQVVKEVTIRGSAPGMSDVARAYDQVTVAADKTATVIDKATKVQLSADQALDKLRKQYQDGYRDQQKYADAQTVYQRAVDQGRISQAAASAELANIQSKLGQATAAQKAFAAATSGVSGQLIAMSAGAGPVGVFLSALGPWGIAASVAIGAVSAAIHGMIDEANRMGDKASEIRKFSEITGLATGQISALRKAGSALGVDSDEITTSIERFTVGLEEARKGSGALFDQIRALNPELALQLAQSTNTAKGIDAYAKALKAAQDTSASQFASLARAGLGRGGQQTALALVSVADLGGLDVAADKTKKVTGLTDDWVKEVAALRDQNKQLEKEIANMKASPYTKEVLEDQNIYLKTQREIVQALIDTGKYNKASFTPAAASAAGVSAGGAYYGGAIDDAESKVAAEQKVRTMSEGAMAANELATALRNTKVAQDDYTDGADRAAARAKTLTESHAAEVKALQLLTNTEKDRLSALGAAATIDERRVQRIREIDVALAEHKIKEEDATRAIAGANLDAALQKFSALNSILGAAATVQDQYRARLQQIAKAQQEGAGATAAQIENAKRLSMAQADGTFQLQAQIDATNVQTKASGMAVGAAEAFSLIQTKINENLNAGRPELDGVTDAYKRLAAAAGAAKQEQAQAAAQDKANFDRQTIFLSDIDQQIAQVQKSIHNNDWPQFMNDGLAATMRINDALKQTRDLTTSFATDFAHEFKSQLQQGASAWDAFKSAGVKALDSLSDKLLDMAIKNMFGQAFGGSSGGGLFGLLFGGGRSLSGATPTVGIAGDLAVPTFHQGGMAGSNLASRYVHPAYFDDAPRYHRGIDFAGGEIPAVLKRGEEVGWPSELAQKYGGSAPINVTVKHEVINQAPDRVSVKQQEVPDGYGGKKTQTVISEVLAGGMNTPGGAADQALRGRGAAPLLKQR